MKAILAWCLVTGALLCLALFLRSLATSSRGVAIVGAVMLTNLGLLGFILKR